MRERLVATSGIDDSGDIATVTMGAPALWLVVVVVVIVAMGCRAEGTLGKVIAGMTTVARLVSSGSSSGSPYTRSKSSPSHEANGAKSSESGDR